MTERCPLPPPILRLGSVAAYSLNAIWSVLAASQNEERRQWRGGDEGSELDPRSDVDVLGRPFDGPEEEEGAADHREPVSLTAVGQQVAEELRASSRESGLNITRLLLARYESLDVSRGPRSAHLAWFNPYTLPGGKLTEQAERRKPLFEGTVPCSVRGSRSEGG